MKRFQFTKFQIAVHVGSLIPLALLIWAFFTNNLTANPIQAATFRTGKAALVLLVCSLACTPLNSVFGFRQALKVRRPLGLYAFMYVVVHFFIFVGVDYLFDLSLIYDAIFEKPYALVGFTAFLLLIPLAVTSTKGWMKRLGKQWSRLHKLIYVIGGLVILHYVWLVKSDVREPLLFGLGVALLLLLRVTRVRKYFGSLRQQFAGWRRRLVNPNKGRPETLVEHS
jgi:methionine sulfoxide reductase heme-binding subunit